MKQLRRYYLYIIIIMVVLFNIERLDFGQQNAINIQTEIYILGSAAVILTLMIPRINRAPVSALLIFWTTIYLAIKVTPLAEHPLFGGVLLFFNHYGVDIYLAARLPDSTSSPDLSGICFSNRNPFYDGYRRFIARSPRSR